MNFRNMALGFVGALALSLSAANAATLHIDGTGQLTGASGVSVGGSLYDVAFVDGTCSGLFDGCDETSDFFFTNRGDADAASQALLDQVFVDGPTGQFDSLPYLTNGIETTLYSGYVYTPYGFLQGPAFYSSVAGNSASESGDGVFATLTSGQGYTRDTSLTDSAVFAVWRVSAVPLPASLPLLIAGLGGLAFMRRRRKVG